MSEYLDAAVARCRFGIHVRYHPATRDSHKSDPDIWTIARSERSVLRDYRQSSTEATAAYLHLVRELERAGK